MANPYHFRVSAPRTAGQPWYHLANSLIPERNTSVKRSFFMITTCLAESNAEVLPVATSQTINYTILSFIFKSSYIRLNNILYLTLLFLINIFMEHKSKTESFSLRKRAKSFTFAFQGLRCLFREEHNARIHLIAAVLAVSFGFILEISTLEWLIVVVSIALVFGFELFNSAIENLCDFVSPGLQPMIKKVKDLAAGAVLLVSLSTLAVGLIIFIPKIITLL